MTTEASLRYMPVQSVHVPQLVSMLPALLSGNWSVEALHSMQQANHQLRVVESAAMVVGFAEFLLVADECQIFNVAVATAWQRQGIGKMLLHAVLTEAAGQGMREAVLEVRESNQAARRLYEQAGFVGTGMRPRYYPPLPGQGGPEAAVLYSCSLAG